MKSDRPKALFEVCGAPMAELVGRAMQGAGADRPVVVIGVCGEEVQGALGEGYDYAWQREQRGTGHAAASASDALKDFDGPVFVAAGDVPLLTSDVFQQLLSRHDEAQAQCTLAVVELDDPTGYGRVIRDDSGRPVRIAEERDASEAERKIREVCVSVYCFDAKTLFRLLPSLSTDNAQGEQYLTDMVEAVAGSGGRVETCFFEEAWLFQGVNDRWQLAQAELALRQHILRRLCEDGVSVVDPATTYVAVDVEVGRDTVLEPMTSIGRGCKIGKNCRIGPSTTIRESTLGDRCVVLMSHLNGAWLENDVRCGPFANLRPGARLHSKSRVGNFVEVKNASLGVAASASHLAYLGDATIGASANIGAGTICCNFDGFQKNRTTIGENAFVGSNTTLIAPVSVGEGAIVAAGSVISHDVPPDSLAIARGQEVIKEQWASKWRRRKEAQSK